MQKSVRHLADFSRGMVGDNLAGNVEQDIQSIGLAECVNICPTKSGQLERIPSIAILEKDQEAANGQNFVFPTLARYGAKHNYAYVQTGYCILGITNLRISATHINTAGRATIQTIEFPDFVLGTATIVLAPDLKWSVCADPVNLNAWILTNGQIVQRLQWTASTLTLSDVITSGTYASVWDKFDLTSSWTSSNYAMGRIGGIWMIKNRLVMIGQQGPKLYLMASRNSNIADFLLVSVNKTNSDPIQLVYDLDESELVINTIYLNDFLIICTTNNIYRIFVGTIGAEAENLLSLTFDKINHSGSPYPGVIHGGDVVILGRDGYLRKLLFVNEYQSFTTILLNPLNRIEIDPAYVLSINSFGNDKKTIVITLPYMQLWFDIDESMVRHWIVKPEAASSNGSTRLVETNAFYYSEPSCVTDDYIFSAGILVATPTYIYTMQAVNNLVITISQYLGDGHSDYYNPNLLSGFGIINLSFDDPTTATSIIYDQDVDIYNYAPGLPYFSTPVCCGRLHTDGDAKITKDPTFGNDFFTDLLIPASPCRSMICLPMEAWIITQRSTSFGLQRGTRKISVDLYLKNSNSVKVGIVGKTLYDVSVITKPVVLDLSISTTDMFQDTGVVHVDIDSDCERAGSQLMVMMDHAYPTNILSLRWDEVVY